MEFKFLDPIQKKIAKNNIRTLGCKIDEINEIEVFAGGDLPHAYKEFLLLMGKDAGVFMRGSDYAYQDIFRLRNAAIELLEFNKFPHPLEKNAFVFWMHQGYQFAFFLLGDGDNPPVYYYHEVKTEENFLQEENFLEFLEVELKQAGLE